MIAIGEHIMEARFKANTKLEICVNADTQKELFEELASNQEIFSKVNTTCGVCQSEETRFVVRHVEKDKDEFDYYEVHCQNPSCRAKLAFGVHQGKAGTVFPKRKDEDGKFLPNNGWTRYVK